MSKSSTATAPKIPSSQLPTKSAWAKGPPQNQSVSPAISRSQSPSNANTPHISHSRKPSGLSGIPIKDGVGVSVAKSIQAPRPASVINFGSIADVSAPVSSSPAPVPTLTRDAANVKSFGSIAANSNGTSPAVTTAPIAAAPIVPSTPASTTSPAAPAKKKIDVHKLFQTSSSPTVPSPPPHSSSFTEVPSPPPRQNPLPSQQPSPGTHVYGYSTNAPHLRGPNGVGAGGPRSPQFPRAMPNGAPRPTGPSTGPASAGLGSPRLAQQQQAAQQAQAAQQQQQQQTQPQPPHQQSQMPQMPPMPPQPWAPYYFYTQPYDVHLPPPSPYWQHGPPPVSHPTPHIPVSPRAQSQSLNSPVPPPTPPATVTSTPPTARLHPTAPSFVPRQAKITIKNVNGEEVDLQSLRKPDGTLESPVMEGSPKIRDRRSIIRMESEDAKKKRLEDQDKTRRADEEKARAKREVVERAKREAEEQERRRKEEETKRKEEAKRKEEEAKRKEEEAKRKEEEAKRKEEELRRKQEEEELAEQERQRKAAEELEKQRDLERKQAEEKEAERLRLEKEAEEARQREEEAKELQRVKELEEQEQERIRHEAALAIPPTSSPASTSVSLAPSSGSKPGTPSETKRRPVPGRLDLSSTSKSDLPKPLPSALASARIIDKLEMVNYPSGVSAPKEELNVGAPSGKFRYDREFLLQFMSICKDKPDLLPPLENLGIELSDQSSPAFPMGRGGSGRRQASGNMTLSGSAASASRATGIGLGIMGPGGSSAFGSKTGPGSAFSGMGNFQPPNRLGSSEERFAASNASRSASVSASSSGTTLPFPRVPMIRSNSQGGPGSATSGGSRESNRVRSQRGNKRNDSNKLGNPPSTVSSSFHSNAHPSLNGAQLEPVAPLGQTPNRWRRSNGPGDDTEAVERKVKSLLNKLTMEKFDSISNQIITWANKSESEKDGRTLILVIKLVFEKATDEAAWSEMYARLCRKMMEQISPEVQDDSIKNADGNPIAGGQLFRKYLLNRCQEDFERGWSAQESAATAAAGKAAGDKEAAEKTAAGEETLYSDEYYIAQKAKRQGLGLVKFIGELFKLQMLTERIMHECIKKLLSNVKNPEEEEIESLCKLLSTVGQALDTSKARNHMDVYFDRMAELAASNNITPRMQFMLQDVIELRARKWVARNATAAPATIAQIHEALAKEKAAEKDSYSRQNRESISRGGSRRDHRSEYSQGPDGWTSITTATAPRPPAKAGDLTHFGKISKPTAMSFGPSSVFAGKKEGKGGRDSPSLSRATSSNMFSMLSNAEVAAEAAAPTSSRPPSRKTSVDLTQAGLPGEGGARKRLQLLPRTKPMDDGKVEETPTGENSSEEDGEIPTTKPSMTIEQAQAKVIEDLKELWGLRDVGEAESYFQSLPPEHHHILMDKLFAKVIDSKESDVQLAVDLLTRVSEKSLCSTAKLEEGFTPTLEYLDDIAVDAPAAYSIAARLMKAAGFSEALVKELASKIAVEGDPVVKPEDKLLKAYATLPSS